MTFLYFDYKMFFQTSYFWGDLKIVVDPFCFTILPKKSKFKKLFLRWGKLISENKSKFLKFAVNIEAEEVLSSLYP